MAQKSLFWNALPDATSPTGYDRNYNGDDISDWLAFVLTTGVIKTDTALKVTAAGGMTVSVGAGRAVINGKGYTNDAAETFTVPTAPTGSTNRIDLIVVRFDKNVSKRKTDLVYITGANNNTVPAIKRDLVYYDLVLAKITVTPNKTTINTGDITDLRGDKESVVTTESGTSLGFCPWLVAVKGYDDYYDAIVLEYEDEITMSAQGTTVQFNIPQYGWTGVDILNVYTNGMREKRENYTVGNGTITFNAAKVAGTKVQVVVDKTIDGEGLGTALEQYQELQTIVLNLQNKDGYSYVCNGVNDNVLISNIVKAYLQGGTDYGTMRLRVYGNIGMTAPVRGNGTTATPYGWFDFNIESNRNVIVDFSSCGQISPTITGGTYNVIFHSNNDIHVIGANVVANNTAENTVIRILNTTSGVVHFENCRFWITAYKDSLISLRGNFVNCRGSVANSINNSYCFLPASNGIVRIICGEYYAYSAGGYSSAIVGQSGANAVSILYGVNAPTVARSGYSQTNSIMQYEGGGMVNCTDLVSALPMVVVSGSSNIRGTIALSKAGSM